VWVVALLVIVVTPSRAEARDRIGGHLDVGLGAGQTQPFITGRATCGTVGLGVSTPLMGPARACFDFRATAGGQFPGGRIPEAANPGQQSLVTFLGGLEFVSRRSLRGAFLTTGLGVGHSAISGARGPTDSPNFGLVPLHDRTAIAFGLGLGCRFSGGPGATAAELALRTNGLLREALSASAYATVITLGLAY
jgi:hypothetical protein